MKDLCTTAVIKSGELYLALILPFCLFLFSYPDNLSEGVVSVCSDFCRTHICTGTCIRKLL